MLFKLLQPMYATFPKLLIAFQRLFMGGIFFLVIAKSYSQNLVPNHDFNFHTLCPTDRGLIEQATHWYSPNYTTTDFSHTCAGVNSITGIPNNRWGYQFPYSGNGYAGIRTWLLRGNTGTGVNYREYLAVELTDTLIAGQTYLLSFKVSIGDHAGFFSDDIGMYVSRDTIPANVVIDVIPQLSNPEGNILRDIANWIEISGNYVAEGGEKFIVIGNFYEDEETTIEEREGYNIDDFLQSTYFYIDDVRVEGCTKYFPQYLISASDSAICPGEKTTLSVPHIRNALYQWEDGTTDSIREVSSAQTYDITIDIEGCIYRDTLEIISKGIPEFSLGADTTLCPGEVLTLTFEGEADLLEWNDQTTQSTLNITSEGLYTLKVTQNECTVRDSINIYYEDLLPAIASIDTLKCREESITLIAADEGMAYLWQDLSSDKTFLADHSGEYWVDIMSNCETRRQSFYINDENCSCESFVQNVFSPNADGINDIFKPRLSQGGVSAYQLQVFDRFGRLVFSTRDTSQAWQGTHQYKNAPEGVYFWVLRYTCKEGGEAREQVLKGHVSLLR